MNGLTDEEEIRLYLVIGIILFGIISAVIFKIVYHPTEEDPSDLDHSRSSVKSEPIRSNDPPKSSDLPSPQSRWSWVRSGDRDRSGDHPLTKGYSSMNPISSVLPMVEWIRLLVERSIHLLLIGGTGEGKTSLAKLLLVLRINIGHRVIVIDPDAARDTWGDLEVIGAGDDFESIDMMFLSLLEEQRLRGEKRSKGTEEESLFQPLTIVVDEVPSLQIHCSTWKAFFEQVGSRGRKREMYLILLTQSNRVGSLGIEGRGDLRENFTKVHLNSRQIESADGKLVSIEFDVNLVRESTPLKRLTGDHSFTPPPVPLPPSETDDVQHTSTPDGGGSPLDQLVDVKGWKKEDFIRWVATETNVSLSQAQDWFRGDQSTISRWVKEERESIEV